MRRYPGVSILQFAIVLGEGHVPSADDPVVGFALGLRTIYVRDCDPETFLARTSLAPLAVLAHGDRAESLHRALVMAKDDPERGMSLREAALTLATITLDAPTIEQIMKETGMTVESIAEFYRETEFGKELLEQGIERGTARTLAAVLRSRFGLHPEIPALADRLAEMPEDDAASLIHESKTLDELLEQVPPAS